MWKMLAELYIRAKYTSSKARPSEVGGKGGGWLESNIDRLVRGVAV